MKFEEWLIEYYGSEMAEGIQDSDTLFHFEDVKAAWDYQQKRIDKLQQMMNIHISGKIKSYSQLQEGREDGKVEEE